MIQLSKEPSVEEYLTEIEPAIQTNLPFFDAITHGLRKKNFYLVSAPAGAGKTTFMLSIMMSAWSSNKDKKFLYIATEQDGYDIKAEVLSNITDIVACDIKEHKAKDKADILREAEKQLDNIYFEYYSDPSFDIIKCLGEAKEMGIEYVFYDYLGAMSNLADSKEWATLEVIADKIKHFALDNDMFIMSAAQGNRKIVETEKAPDLFDESSLAKSIGIARKATVGFVLYRPKAADGFPNNNGNIKYCYLDMYKNRDMADKIRSIIRMDYAHNRIITGGVQGEQEENNKIY